MTDFIVDPLVDFCVDVIGEIGYLGIFLLMLVESANIPMPSEATMLFAGFKVDDGELTLFGIIAAGVLGNIVGSWAGYAIGYYGREELLERHKVFHVSPKQMARVEGWFERYGASRSSSPGCCRSSAPSSRLRREPPTCPSGGSRSTPRLGCIPWVLVLGIIGVEVGARWEEWRDKLHYFDYVVIAGHHRARRLPADQAARRRRARGREAEPREPRRARGEATGHRGLRSRRPAIAAGRADSALAGRSPSARSRDRPSCCPVSSSAHLTLIPWLAGWDWERLDPELRKSFEVALHAGAAAALLLGQRQVIADELRVLRLAQGGGARALVRAARPRSGSRSSARSSGDLGGPLPTALGLLAGAAAMALADRRPQSRGAGPRRCRATASRWGSRRRRRWCPASRATARP